MVTFCGNCKRKLYRIYPFEILYVAYNTCTTVYSIIMCEYGCTYTILCEKSFLVKPESRPKGRLTKLRRCKKKKTCKGCMKYVLENSFVCVIRTIYHNIAYIIYRCVIIITIALRLSTKLLFSRPSRPFSTDAHTYIGKCNIYTYIHVRTRRARNYFSSFFCLCCSFIT